MVTCEMCNIELDDIELEACIKDNTSMLCDDCWCILCNYWIPYEYEETP